MYRFSLNIEKTLSHILYSFLLLEEFLLEMFWDIAPFGCLFWVYAKEDLMGALSPLWNDMETLKDRVLPVDKIFFQKRTSYFAYYKKNYL